MNSEQLELALDDVRLKIPWGGQSPRGLTTAYERFTLKTQGAEKRERFSLCARCDYYIVTTRGGPTRGGAPTLLPLPKGV